MLKVSDPTVSRSPQGKAHRQMTPLTFLGGTVGLALVLAACGAGDTPTTSPGVEEAWNICQATSDAQDYDGAYDGIKPDGAILPIMLEGVTVTENPGASSITFRGSVEGVQFQCTYNTFAKVAAVDWGS